MTLFLNKDETTHENLHILNELFEKPFEPETVSRSKYENQCKSILDFFKQEVPEENYARVDNTHVTALLTSTTLI